MDKVFSAYSEDYDEVSDSKILSAVVSYDTSCLLNLYRCTENSRGEMLNMMKVIDQKFGHFITHHVAFEFSVNKDDAKKDVDSKFAMIQSSFAKFKKDIRGSLKLDGLKTPLEELNNDISPLLDGIHKALVGNKKRITKERSHDSIFDSVGGMFSGKVTDEFDSENLERISLEGNYRFSCKIPPGFEDGSKDEFINIGGVGVDKKFGDLIVWFQLMDYAKNNSKDLIFITADEKQDWFVTARGGKRMRPDLAHEFLSKTGQSIFCYSLKDFERKYKKHLKFKFSSETKDELVGFEKEYGSWLDEILAAFEYFGGEATLRELYSFIKESSSRVFSANWEVTVRRTIYNHSSDVNAYLGKADLFERSDKGRWKLRK